MITSHGNLFAQCPSFEETFPNPSASPPITSLLLSEPDHVGPLTYLILLLTSSLPGFASSYSACFVSGPPGPSKSRALVGLGGEEVSLCLSRIHSFIHSREATYWPEPPFSPGLEIRSPPSSTGISRLSPAPEAAEPTLMVLPGNFSVTLVSTPESVAGGVVRSGGW